MNTVIINFLLAGLLLVIAIFLLVYIIDYYKRNKNKKTLLAKLNKIAAYHQAKMSTVAFPGDRVIGIDSESKILIFFTEGTKAEIINLKDVAYCNIKKHFHKRRLYSVQLELIKIDAEKTYLLPFYQKPVDSEFALFAAIQKASCWHKIISDCLPGTIPCADLLRFSDNIL